MAESIIHKRFNRALARELEVMGYMADVEVPRKEGGAFDVYGTRGNENISVEIWNTHLPDWIRLPEWIKYLLDSWLKTLPDCIIQIGGKSSDRGYTNEHTSYRTQCDDLHNKQDLKEDLEAHDKTIGYENEKDVRIVIRKIISDTKRRYGQRNSKTLSISEREIIDHEINRLILYIEREPPEEEWWACDPSRSLNAELVHKMLCQELGITYIEPTEPRFYCKDDFKKHCTLPRTAYKPLRYHDEKISVSEISLT